MQRWKIRGWSLVGLGAALGIGCADAGVSGEDLEVSYRAEAAVSRRSDRVIVKFKDGVNETSRRGAHGRHGAARVKKGRGGEDVVRVAPGRAEAEASAYARDPEVLWAEVDTIQPHTQVTPNDPLFGSQWQHTNMRSTAGWAVGTGSSSVQIAICDTGVSLDHPDLAANLRTDLCWNTADGKAGNCGPVEMHGTAVAGSAAAVGNNGVGVAGVAWSAQIIPVRVSNFLDGSAYTSDLADCVRYAADKGAEVANLSYSTYTSGKIDQVILDAANYAETKGTLVVAAAGNENTNAITTQDPASIFYVAATNSSNGRSSFSNYGTFVDIAAPGSSIYTTDTYVTCIDSNNDDWAESCTVTGNGYTYISGTSFSSPFVAGAAAVLKALKPSATPADIRAALRSSAKDLGTAGEDSSFGAGLVDLGAAAQLFAPPVGPDTAPTLTLTAPATTTVAVDSGATVTFSGTATDTWDGNIASKIAWTLGTATKTGASVTFTFGAAGTFQVKGVVSDAGGQTAEVAVDVTVTNTAPTLTLTAPAGGSATVAAGGSVTFSGSVADAEQSNLASGIVWSLPGTASKTGASVSFAFLTEGSFVVTGTVTDAGGLTSSATATVTVTAPPPFTAPTGVTATVTTSRVATVTWTDSTGNETGFRLQRSKANNKGQFTSYATVATVGANVTTFSQALSKGTYSYRVVAYNATQSATSSAVTLIVR
jgi:thermitase